VRLSSPKTVVDIENTFLEKLIEFVRHILEWKQSEILAFIAKPCTFLANKKDGDYWKLRRRTGIHLPFIEANYTKVANNSLWLNDL